MSSFYDTYSKPHHILLFLLSKPSDSYDFEKHLRKTSLPYPVDGQNPFGNENIGYRSPYRAYLSLLEGMLDFSIWFEDFVLSRSLGEQVYICVVHLWIV